MIKHIEKIFTSAILCLFGLQYYGFYLFAGWRGVFCALCSMILYGLIAWNFRNVAERAQEQANAYRAELHNVINDRNNLENELFNAKQVLRIHGLTK